MGCDIHLYTEYRKEGRWIAADAFTTDTRYGESAMRVPYHLRPYSGRNYNFFSWLANVRNGTWGEEIPVISKPRGIPEDVSKTIACCAEEWNGDGHSHSWLTFEELNEAWNKMKDTKIRFHGAFHASDEWLAMPEDERPAPDGYAASGWGPEGELPKHYWKQALHFLIKGSWDRLREYLFNLEIEFCVREDKDIRIVFWFDN